jgi:hypothetical protein
LEQPGRRSRKRFTTVQRDLSSLRDPGRSNRGHPRALWERRLDQLDSFLHELKE